MMYNCNMLKSSCLCGDRFDCCENFIANRTGKQKITNKFPIKTDGDKLAAATAAVIATTTADGGGGGDGCAF